MAARKPVWPAALLACLWLASCDVAEQDQRMAGGGIETGNTGALSGRVVDGNGYAMQRMQVDLVRMAFGPEGPSGGVILATTTDTAGWYRFNDVPEGSLAVFASIRAETPMAGVLTRLRFAGDPVELPDVVAHCVVALQGRILPAPGVDVSSIHACIPGIHACVLPGADSVYRFSEAPQGSYEIVFLMGASAHYLAVEVGPETGDTLYLKDVALVDSAGDTRVPYQFYASTLPRSYSILPVEYPQGLEPAWYRGKTFGSVRYSLLNDGHPVQPLSVDYFTQWKYRKVLSGASLAPIPGLESPLAGFILPVRLSAPDFDFSQALPDGSDLVVSDGAGHLLPHEIERWDAAAGKAEIWVRLDTLAPAAADRAITLHWGHAESVPLAGGAGVFRAENGFIGVWHLNDRTPDRVVSEARGRYPGTLADVGAGDDPNQVRAGEAVIAGGHRLGKIFARVDVAQKAGLDVSSAFTYLTWAKSYHHDATHDQVLASKWKSDRRAWVATLLADETLEVKFGDGAGWTLATVRSTSPIANPDSWHHYGVVFDQGAVRLFLDGAEIKSQVVQGAIPGAVSRADADFQIGSHTMDRYTNWEGEIDEAEYFSTAKSGAWIGAAFNSQKP